VRVVVLDTGWAGEYEPSDLRPPGLDPQGFDGPDEADDGFLDPAAGHGTFIAGVIEQLVPGCEIEVHRVLSTFGDGDEKDGTTHERGFWRAAGSAEFYERHLADDGLLIIPGVDRVLDKISEKGISSLTAAERRFLDEVAKQKRKP
jgi:hypothetical protein